MAMFRGASADAVAVLTEQLESALSSSAKAARVANDLFTVAATIRTEGALRRFLTDASLPAEAKTGLVEQVFGEGRVEDASLGVLTEAVSRRWTVSRDLADALEHLSVVAHVRSAVDGRRSDTGRLADEIFGFAQLVKDHPELRDALSDPARSVDDKSALVESLLDGKALPATIALAKQSVAGTYRTVGRALTEYERVAADVHGQGVATVRVAREMTDAELQRLTDALADQYDRPVHVNVVIDPTVLGGVRIEIGDDVIDGTVSNRLDDARRRLAG